MKTMKNILSAAILMFSVISNAQVNVTINTFSNPGIQITVNKNMDTIYLPVVLTDSIYLNNIAAFLQDLGTNINATNWVIQAMTNIYLYNINPNYTTGVQETGIPVKDYDIMYIQLRAPSGIVGFSSTPLKFFVKPVLASSTSIDKGAKKSSDLKAYPNPVIDKLTVDFNTTVQTANIEVFDIQGRLVLSNTDEREIGQNSVKLDVSTLNKGFYFVRIGADTFKVTKQ